MATVPQLAQDVIEAVKYTTLEVFENKHGRGHQFAELFLVIPAFLEALDVCHVDLKNCDDSTSPAITEEKRLSAVFDAATNLSETAAFQKYRGHLNAKNIASDLVTELEKMALMLVKRT